MQTQRIRARITAAIAHEGKTGALARDLAPRLPDLRRVLLLPAEDPVAALVRFIERYVRGVPGCMRLVAALGKRRGFDAFAAPFLAVAEDYLVHVSDTDAQGEGLGAILDGAFLAHRLLEEIDDHHVRHLQRPLLPVDMTESNIIVHHLLGDAFASRLEQLVALTARDQLQLETVWENVRQQEPGKHPGFEAGDLSPERDGIRLRLAS